MVASQNMRNKAILGDDVDPDLNLSPMQYCVLEYIAQSRIYGRLQRGMPSYFNIDIKTLFFVLKILIAMGFIKKQVMI